MTSDRHLALMDLMREIGEPTKAYQRSVRLAAALGSNTPQWDSAVDKGKAALDLIEQSVRAWVAAHPEPGALSDLERARSIAVALEQENAKLTEELAEVKAANDPRLRGLLVKAAPDKDLYVQWSTVCDMPGGVFSRETALDYGFPRSKVDHADEHGSSSRLGDGAWDDKGWVAEQRGWLRRDRLGDYAVEYLTGDREAAFDLLVPFEGETEVRR
ncbi:hypothetical protein [Streptomyces europaeiscabiei]|uniref:hypothetical protein n=1 Tax=Streptomyces europaeiscabiei TaxID=146819 RepID=UPI002E1807BF